MPGSELEEVPGGGASYDEAEPLCSIALQCDAEVPDAPKLPCRLRIDDHDGAARYDGWAGVELRGRSSSGFPKRHYNIELWRGGHTRIEPGAAWRYLDTGVDPGGQWRTVEYDDGHWGVGAAPLGYDSSETTTVSYGGDPSHKHVTTWLRGRFEVEDASLVGPLTISLRRDDGAAVYLNGTEVGRSNLPDGVVTADTLATADVEGTFEVRYFDLVAPAELVVDGTNVLAVELHQASPSSSDLGFDLWLGDVGDEVDVDLFGMGAESDWVANGNYADRALFRNKLSFDLFQSFGEERYAAQSVLCELTLDGDWLGVFTLGERIKRDDARVDIAEDPDDLGRSFIVKNDDGGGCFMPAEAVYGEWCLVYPRPDRASEPAREGIVTALQAFEDAVTGPDPGDPHAGVFAHLDLDSAVDWILLQELSKNNDAYFLSVYLYRDLEGPLMLLPWDLDLAYGGYPVNNCDATGWVAYRTSLVHAFAAVPEFQQRLVERWTELRAGPLSEDSLLQRVHTCRDILGDDAHANFEVWPMDEIEFSWDGINWLCPVATYDEEMARLDDWLLTRLAWMDANIHAF